MSIKLIIFDLDGVLVETKQLHFLSLNQALEKIAPQYIISLEDHLNKYDGLPTQRKLELLTKEKGLPIEAYKAIYDLKQQLTFQLIKEQIKPDLRLVEVLKQLKQDHFKIYVASNAIRETVKLLLLKSGLLEYVDHFLSNEDCKLNKPSPEIYLKCFIEAGVSPGETLIIEDSPKGIEAARKAKANLLVVKNPSEVTYETIKMALTQEIVSEKFKWKNLNILIPAAGAGSRFAQAGYVFPKPLIEVNGKPMLELVVNNLSYAANYIFLVRKEHYEKYNMKNFLNLIAPNCKIIQVDALTQGAACTALLAKELINNDAPLIIANSDQYMEWNPIEFYYNMIETKADGGIISFTSTHPKWSFCRVENDLVVEVAEKKPISDIATTGVYYYAKGSDFVKYAEQMIAKDIRVNSEFYVCPVFNEMIADNKKVRIYPCKKMWGIGTPIDLDYFLKNFKT